MRRAPLGISILRWPSKIARPEGSNRNRDLVLPAATVRRLISAPLGSVSRTPDLLVRILCPLFNLFWLIKASSVSSTPQDDCTFEEPIPPGLHALSNGAKSTLRIFSSYESEIRNHQLQWWPPRCKRRRCSSMLGSPWADDSYQSNMNAALCVAAVAAESGGARRSCGAWRTVSRDDSTLLQGSNIICELHTNRP